MCILPIIANATVETFAEDNEFIAITRFGQSEVVEIYHVDEPHRPGLTFIRSFGEIVHRGECESFYESPYAPTPRR